MENQTAKTPGAITATVAQLLSVAASMAAGFEAGLEYHVKKGRTLGLTDEDLIQAANVGLKLRQASMESAVHSAREMLAPGEKDAEGHEHGGGGCGCGHGGGGGCGDDHGH
jgi:alkylhydroperoxidase/carboxymuconolactone decarboxylase family protein YurZ